MIKNNALRRFFLPCFTPAVPTSSAATTTTTATKKRLSTSLRDDIQDPPRKTQENAKRDQEVDENNDGSSTAAAAVAQPRTSKTMVIGTIFGHRRGHVWFCVQHDRLSARPALLLELPIPTYLLVKEMQCGFVRIALETQAQPDSELGSCPLHSVPIWNMLCNGRKLGFAGQRKSTEATRLMLKTMQSITVGAGVLPAGFGFGCGSLEGDGELMYMRANYECIVGGPDSESFHLINPDECPGQELSIFLMRSG